MTFFDIDAEDAATLEAEIQRRIKVAFEQAMDEEARRLYAIETAPGELGAFFRVVSEDRP